MGKNDTHILGLSLLVEINQSRRAGQSPYREQKQLEIHTNFNRSLPDKTTLET
jgi:hypothetical protein